MSGGRIEAALSLWRLVALVRRQSAVPPAVRDRVRWLAFDVTAALGGRVQVQGQRCDHDTALDALDALLDALVERGVSWPDVVTRVNAFRERRPG